MSTIGIVILNYNDYKTTRIMLDNIKGYKSLDHIVVVDNNSPDSSYELLKEYQSNKIDVIKSDENKGYSSGNNYGCKYLIDNYDVDYIIISNPDISVDNDVIDKLKKTLDENDDIKVLAPTIDELGTIKRGWMLPTYYGEVITIMNTKQRFHKNYGLYEEDHYKDELSEVDVVSGCFFVIRSDVLKELDYFDTGTFLYYEENILGHRLKEKEYGTYVLNDVSVTHNLSVSVDKSVKKINKFKILVKSLLYYEKEYNNLSGFKLFILKFLYIIALIIAYIKSFLLSIFG